MQPWLREKSFPSKISLGNSVVPAFVKESQEENALRKEWVDAEQNREEMQGARQPWHLQDQTLRPFSRNYE